MTTKPMEPKKSPRRPSTSTKGRNAAIVVSTPEDDWNGDLPGAVNGGLHPALAQLFMGVDALPHHDGVIHQNAQHQNEGDDR